MTISILYFNGLEVSTVIEETSLIIAILLMWLFESKWVSVAIIAITHLLSNYVLLSKQ